MKTKSLQLVASNSKGDTEVLWIVLAVIIVILIVLLGFLIAGKMHGLGTFVIDLWD